jgi:hypothetical protein
MRDTARFARRVFAFAGVYGLLTMLPLYALEERIGRDTPPAITHPEYFYGFVGITVAWQLLFLVIARAPARLRPAMPAAVVEKLAFGVPALALFAQHRIPTTVLGFGCFDLVLAALFFLAYRRTADPPSAG